MDDLLKTIELRNKELKRKPKNDEELKIKRANELSAEIRAQENKKELEGRRREIAWDFISHNSASDVYALTTYHGESMFDKTERIDGPNGPIISSKSGRVFEGIANIDGKYVYVRISTNTFIPEHGYESYRVCDGFIVDTKGNVREIKEAESFDLGCERCLPTEKQVHDYFAEEKKKAAGKKKTDEGVANDPSARAY